MAKKETHAETPIETKLGNMQMQAESLVCDARDLLIGILKEFIPTYDSIKEDQQKILHHDVEHKCKEIIHEAIRIIAEKGSACVPAKLEGFTVKGGDIKVSLKIGDIEDNFSAIGAMRGKEVMLVGIALSDFNELQTEAEIVPDQRDLLDQEEQALKDAQAEEAEDWGDQVKKAVTSSRKKK